MLHPHRLIILLLLLVLPSCGGSDQPAKDNPAKNGQSDPETKALKPSEVNAKEMLGNTVVVEGVVAGIESGGYEGSRGRLLLCDTYTYEQTAFVRAGIEGEPAPWSKAMPGQTVRVKARVAMGDLNDLQILKVTGESKAPVLDASAMTQEAEADGDAFDAKYATDFEKKPGFAVVVGKVLEKAGTSEIVLTLSGHGTWKVECRLLETWYDKPIKAGDTVKVLGKVASLSTPNYVQLRGAVILDK